MIKMEQFWWLISVQFFFFFCCCLRVLIFSCFQLFAFICTYFCWCFCLFWKVHVFILFAYVAIFCTNSNESYYLATQGPKENFHLVRKTIELNFLRQTVLVNCLSNNRYQVFTKNLILLLMHAPLGFILQLVVTQIGIKKLHSSKKT